MDVISYGNINISGFPFHKIVSLKIHHTPNEHGKAEIVGEIESSGAQDLIQRVDERTQVLITTTAEGQPSVLFCGCIGNVSLEQENEYSRIHLNLYSTSRLLDMMKHDRTFQNVDKTYGEIISGNIKQIGDLHMMVSDKAIGKLVMQYSETDWEFAKRMASQLKAPIITNLSSERPQIYIGLPPVGKMIDVESASYSYGNNSDEFFKQSGGMAQDFAEQQVETYSYAYIGDRVVFDGKIKTIKSVQAYLEDGIMRIRYGILDAAVTSAGGSLAGVAVPMTVNSQASGKMMKGVVEAVHQDKVKVHLIDVDSSYDEGGNWWFPYSTAYSSSDGSGWYCMPEVKDEVRVFFPSGDEGEAFAASSVCVTPPSNPRHKSWKAPGGKQILLTDEGMYIIGKSGRIYINLTDERGIDIYSDKDINVTANGNISITAANTLQMVAKNEILIGTEEAYLDMTKGTTTLAASQVLIN